MTVPVRYLIIEGPQTALRICLPPLGQFTIGSGASCEIQLREQGVLPEHARVFLDPNIGATILKTPAEVTRISSNTPRRLAEGDTIDLDFGDGLRLGDLELLFSRSTSEPRDHHLWSRTYLNDALQQRATVNERWVAACLEVKRVTPDRVAEIAFSDLGERDLIGALDRDRYGLLLEGTEARARAALRRITRNLSSEGEGVRVGLAPAEGKQGGAAFEAAATRLSGGSDSGPLQAVLDSSVAKMQAVLQALSQVASTSTPVLLLGETGVGKDVLARALHERSDRAAGPLLRLNCVGLTDAFKAGHERALLSRATGGTLLLDEVSGLSPRAQIELGYLLELEDAEWDVRFVATSNQDLQAAVRAGEFRRDLYFRLGRVVLEIPPLRDRKADLPALCRHFLGEASRDTGRKVSLSSPAAAHLEAHHWPGNIRELRNVLERAVLRSSEHPIRVEDLALDLGSPASTEPQESTARPNPAPTNLREEMAALERRRILEALDAYPTQTEAAKALGIPLRTFLNRLDAFGIPRARKKD